MDITSISGISNVSNNSLLKSASKSSSNVESFDNILQSAMSMIQETNDLTHDAEEASLSYAMGLTDSTHDLTIAQQKALTAIQYTVAVRDAVVDAYKEIMQLQF